MEEKQRVNELPWDRPKPDPADVDMFETLGVDVGKPAADRLALARIAAEPILGTLDKGPGTA